MKDIKICLLTGFKDDDRNLAVLCNNRNVQLATLDKRNLSCKKCLLLSKTKRKR